MQEDRQEFMNDVWLVIDSASGLDRNIAEAALESRDRVRAVPLDGFTASAVTSDVGDMSNQSGRINEGSR